MTDFIQLNKKLKRENSVCYLHGPLEWTVYDREWHISVIIAVRQSSETFVVV